MGGSLSANQGVESGLPYRGLWSGLHGRWPIPPKLDKELGDDRGEGNAYAEAQGVFRPVSLMRVCLSGQLEDTIRDNSS